MPLIRVTDKIHKQIMDKRDYENGSASDVIESMFRDIQNDKEAVPHDIDNYNVGEICFEKKCSNKYTHFIYHTVNGVELIIPICAKHADEILNGCKHD